MKKIIVLFSILFATSTFANIYNVRVNNDMLVFNTRLDYEKVVGKFTKVEREEFINFINANMDFDKLASFTNTANYLDVNDGFIEFILNKDGFVQINNFIYKLDVSNGVVATIDAINYNDLISYLNTGNYTGSTLIRTFSTDESVIELTETNQPSGSRLFCGQSGAGGDKKEDRVILNTPIPAPPATSNVVGCGQLWGEVKYVHAGLYFGLVAKYRNGCPSRTVLYHQTPMGYIVKCRPNNGWPAQYIWNVATGGVGGTNTTWVNHFYIDANNPLHAYWLRIVFMAKDANWISNPDNPSVDLEIRKNM